MKFIGMPLEMLQALIDAAEQYVPADDDAAGGALVEKAVAEARRQLAVKEPTLFDPPAEGCFSFSSRLKQALLDQSLPEFGAYEIAANGKGVVRWDMIGFEITGDNLARVQVFRQGLPIARCVASFPTLPNTLYLSGMNGYFDVTLTP